MNSNWIHPISKPPSSKNLGKMIQSSLNSKNHSKKRTPRSTGSLKESCEKKKKRREKTYFSKKDQKSFFLFTQSSTNRYTSSTTDKNAKKTVFLMGYTARRNQPSKFPRKKILTLFPKHKPLLTILDIPPSSFQQRRGSLKTWSAFI